MEVSVRLYGDFRDLAPELDKVSSSVGLLDLKLEQGSSIEDLLADFELEGEGVSHVFVDGEYSSLNRELKDGNRVALFPSDMGLLYSWYFEEKK
ncbi:MAG: MoaD/ThiS family protein [Candidatus Acetothermia bacterium]